MRSRRDRLCVTALYVVLVAIACLPIWWFEYFNTQDGPVNVYAAEIMGELLRGNDFYLRTFQLNPVVPNSLGHWLLWFLMLFTGPVIAGKLVVTGIYGGFVASVAWLRHRTTTRASLPLTLLLAAALAFNSMWLMGFYNFSMGVCLYAFALGLYWPWRQEMTVARALILALLLVGTYFCHLFCFGALAFSIAVVALSSSRASSRNNFSLTAASLVPGSVLALYYFLIGNGSPISPDWWIFNAPVSVGSLILQIRTADPFVILRGRALPMMAGESSWFILFAPGLWIALGAVLIWVSRLYRRDERKALFAAYGPLLLLLAVFLTAALIGPDALGEFQGGIIRPRVMLIASTLLVPLIPSKMPMWLTRSLLVILVYVFAFQGAVVWEYAAASNKDASRVMDAAHHIPDDENLVALTYLPSSPFTIEPRMNISSIAGPARNIAVWNSYEGAYPYFPISMRSAADKTFAHALEDVSRIQLKPDDDDGSSKRQRMGAAIETHGNVDILMVIGDPVTESNNDFDTFEDAPFYENGTVKLFHRKR